MRRKKPQREVDRELLDATFAIESDWRTLRHIVDRSVDPLDEARNKLLLAEAKYMFLIKEAKHRKISVLRY